MSSSSDGVFLACQHPQIATNHEDFSWRRLGRSREVTGAEFERVCSLTDTFSGCGLQAASVFLPERGLGVTVV